MLCRTAAAQFIYIFYLISRAAFRGREAPPPHSQGGLLPPLDFWKVNIAYVRFAPLHFGNSQFALATFSVCSPNKYD